MVICHYCRKPVTGARYIDGKNTLHLECVAPEKALKQKLIRKELVKRFIVSLRKHERYVINSAIQGRKHIDMLAIPYGRDYFFCTPQGKVRRVYEK